MKIEKVNLSEINDALAGHFDLFLCTSSFENRCLSVAKNINTSNLKNAIIYFNRDLRDHVNFNLQRLQKYLGKISNSVELSTSDPIFSADQMIQSISSAIDVSKKTTVLIDVTTFTHEFLMIILQIFKERFPNSTLKGLYSNAKSYSTKKDLEKKWLSWGIREVRSVLGYPGDIIPTRKTHLILIVGYEYERASSLIEFIEPSSISLGYGKSASATTEKNQEANELYMRLVKQAAVSFSDVGKFEIPCNNPYEAQIEIERQIVNFPEMNVLISPMNNKLTTIATARAVMNRTNAQVCYAQAVHYNYLNYSEPGSQCYVFDLI
jgi:hypothetical protein